jgi:hypothetical protein
MGWFSKKNCRPICRRPKAELSADYRKREAPNPQMRGASRARFTFSFRRLRLQPNLALQAIAAYLANYVNSQTLERVAGARAGALQGSARSLRLGGLSVVRGIPLAGPEVILIINLPLNFQVIDSDFFKVMISAGVAQHLPNDRMGVSGLGHQRRENERDDCCSLHSGTLGSK